MTIRTVGRTRSQRNSQRLCLNERLTEVSIPTPPGELQRVFCSQNRVDQFPTTQAIHLLEVRDMLSDAVRNTHNEINHFSDELRSELHGAAAPLKELRELTYAMGLPPMILTFDRSTASNFPAQSTDLAVERIADRTDMSPVNATKVSDLPGIALNIADAVEENARSVNSIGRWPTHSKNSDLNRSAERILL
jgi:hypothetical protein